MKKHYPLFNFYFVTITLINFCISAVFYLTTIVSTSYAIHELNSSINMAGLASGIFIIGTMIARIYIGKKLDVINLKKWLLISLICYTLTTTLYFFSYQISILSITRFLNGLCFGFGSSICGTIVARLIPSFKRGAGIGYYALGTVFASAIAPLCGVYLANHNKFNIAFICSLCIIVFSMLLVFLMKVREIRQGNITLEIKKKSIISKIPEYFEPSVWKISVIIFIAGFAYGGILSFIGEYCREQNLIFAGSIFFAIYAIVSLFGRPIGGNIFDRKGYNAILIPSLIFFTLSLFLIAFAKESWMLILAAVFVGLGYGNLFSSGQSYAISIAPKNKMGLATSSYYMSLDCGMGIGPYALGFIANRFHYNNMFAFSGVLIIVATLLYFALIFKKYSTSNKNLT